MTTSKLVLSAGILPETVHTGSCLAYRTYISDMSIYRCSVALVDIASIVVHQLAQAAVKRDNVYTCLVCKSLGILVALIA